MGSELTDEGDVTYLALYRERDKLRAENARLREADECAKRHAALLAAEITMKNRRINVLEDALETAMGHVADDECRQEARDALEGKGT
ncbi:hypothetical protein EHM76_05095 [bacterium]|nr:MAG: hypothetical protein EHM76_05095 [bacterium]